MKKTIGILAFGLMASSGSALAQFDARSLALGGTGVASANSANAAAHNPALLATPNNNKRMSIIPFSFKADVVDENDFIDNIEAVDENINGTSSSTGLNELMTDLEGGTGGPGLTKTTDCSDASAAFCYTGTGTTMADAGAKASELTALLEEFNTSAGLINAGAGTAFSMGTKTKPFALIMDISTILRAGVKVPSSDLDEINTYADVMLDGEITISEITELGDLFSYVPGSDDSIDFNRGDGIGEDDVNSFVEILGAFKTEVGISFADSFQYKGVDLAVGFTPKVVNIEAVKFHQSAADDDIDSDDVFDDENTVEKSDFNVDVGLAFKPLDTQPLQLGFTMKNLFTRTYDLKETSHQLSLEGELSNEELASLDITNQIKIEPQLTAGAYYNLKILKLMADMDLNEAEVLGRTTQYLSLGAEVDLRFLKFQVGHRSAIGGDDEEAAISAGLTLGILDLAAISSGDHVGGVIQTSFSF